MTIEVNGTAATRLGELYHRSLTASNTTVPVWQEVETEDSDGDPSVTSYFWYDPQSQSPGYDEDGNLVNDGRWVYTWDAENRLIQMETTTAATTAGHPYTKLVFHYDGEGRRLSRTVYRGGPTTHESTRRWLYDGWNPIVEYSATSESATSVTRLNTLTWGTDLSGSLQGAGGVGGLLAQIGVSGGEVYRASYDGNGNVVSWTKSDQATAEWRTEYDAFGNPTVTEGMSPSEHGFSTKIRDPYTGLSYYGYRYYDPVTGRWPSRDPIEERGGMNLYGFAFNNAIGFFDVNGQFISGWGAGTGDRNSPLHGHNNPFGPDPNFGGLHKKCGKIVRRKIEGSLLRVDRCGYCHTFIIPADVDGSDPGRNLDHGGSGRYEKEATFEDIYIKKDWDCEKFTKCLRDYFDKLGDYNLVTNNCHMSVSGSISHCKKEMDEFK